MKLFLSYSRDDKPWVTELWRLLQESDHHTFLDVKGIVPAQDWWATILSNIESAECVIYIMAPKAVESIYCQAEVSYALALNKPVLPLMLKSCDYPSELGDRRIQYQTITDTMSLDRVLAIIERALGRVQVGWIQHKFDSPISPPPRPSVPRPDPKTNQAGEVFLLAADAAATGNDALADKLYQQVIEADPDGWGEAAQERLMELRQDRQRYADYKRVKHLRDSGYLKDARSAWRVYVRKHGPGDDPDGLATLANPTNPPEAEGGYRGSGKHIAMPSEDEYNAWVEGLGLASTPQPELPKDDPDPFNFDGGPFQSPLMPDQSPSTNQFLLRRALRFVNSRFGDELKVSAPELLPQPFEWVEIPAGKVTLESGGYLKEETTFEVPIFAIAKYPITNAQYAKFIEAGGYSQKPWWTEAGWEARERESWTGPRYWYSEKWKQPDCAVVGVTWYEAVAFCRWLSEAMSEAVTLPTEQQWQRAAQGDGARMYPWGNEEPNDRLCNFDINIGHPTSVTRYPAGSSPYGVMDMSGNVWEWCLTSFETGRNDLSGTDLRVLRGGSWNDDRWFVRSAYRNVSLPDKDDDGGFRVCASAPT